MNYFAHGMRYVDRPYFMAGTAVPDWLSVADRKVRMRERRVAPFVDGSQSIQAEVAAGVMQHLDDDRWFHQSRTFFETTGEMTVLFRQVLGRDDGFRPSFLGHIVTELLLDAVLIKQHPGLLDRYYQQLADLDPSKVEAAVNCLAKQPTARLAPLIPRFVQEGFLWDYLQPAGMLTRLNQVMHRIKLKQLPVEIEAVLEAGFEIVAAQQDRLLPAEHFQISS